MVQEVQEVQEVQMERVVIVDCNGSEMLTGNCQL